MLNRLKRRIPNPVKTKIRYAYYLLASPLERLSRDPLTPPRRLVFVGASDFRKIGHELFQCFVDPGGLQPDDSVLDVGCGIGRMAVPLTGYLSSASRYEGFDVVPVGIEWCRSHITPRFPNFRFQLADIRNKTYNPGGSYQADAYAFPYPADSFDFVIAISVFTHMLPADVKHYVSEIARAMRPGARSFITCFLLNPDSKLRMESGLSNRYFRQQPDGYYTVDERVAEMAIGYDEQVIREFYEADGLNIEEPIRYGLWSGKGDALTVQDVIIATKV